jgi:signal transduction histidine kinase
MKFGLRNKLFSGFALIILLFSITGLAGLSYLQLVVDSLDRTLSYPMVVNQASQDVESLVLSMQRTMYGICLSREKADIDRNVSAIRTKEDQVLGLFSIMQRQMIENDGRKMALQARIRFYQWRPIREKAITLAMMGKSDQAQIIILNVGDPYVQSLQDALDQIGEYSIHRANFFTEASIREASKAKIIGVISIVLSILFSLAITFYLSLSITRRLRSIRMATTLMAKGDLKQSLEIKGNDELTQVAMNFNSMAKDLSGMYEDLEKKVEERTRELLEANEELHRVKGELEIKVNERTKDLEEKISELNRSQLAMLYMVEDLNETARQLKTTQEELIRKERLAILGEFSGNISHELRNPLGVIDSSIYYLQMRLNEKDEKVLQHLDRISQSVKNATAIIENLLNLTRMNKPLLATYNLTDLLEGCMKSFKIPDGISLVKNFQDSVIMVKAEKDQIRMVIDNLMKNALAAMSGKGTLTIQTRTTKDAEAEISFADTGSGISVDPVEKVFLPLFTTKAKGIGLGLSITKMIVENHGGKISVETEPGKGANFIIRLPLSKYGPGDTSENTINPGETT